MLPSLARLAPTGTQAAQEVLEKRDLFDAILHAIVANDPDLACKLAITWCDLNSEHRDACKDAWEDLADRVFPNTARLRALFADKPWADARKVFIGLCNTKPILREWYAKHVYFQLHSYLQYVSQHRFLPDGWNTVSVRRPDTLGEFTHDANAWATRADRAVRNDAYRSREAYRHVLVLSDELPLSRIRGLVREYSSNAIYEAVDWGRGGNAPRAKRFVFEVSIEDKKKAMEALVDACVEATLTLLEQGLVESFLVTPPAQVTDLLKEKMRAPFQNYT